MHAQAQTGSSLIEILVTTLILSIGLLGLAALQANSLRFNQDAYFRSVATSQTDIMVDRMHANLAGVSNGLYDNISGIGSNPGCSTCTSAEVAQRDAFEWNSQNNTLLPSGQGTVTVAGDVHTITLRWDGRRTGATGLGCSGNPDVDLNCLQIDVRL